MAAPARLFVIRARDGRSAVVFRRGPSKLWQMLRWDLKTDAVEPGQWLKAAVYPRRADLSPDGRHVIYFAATHKGGPGANWTAISRPPYWTALHWYGQDHAWNGGGVFLDNARYWPDLGFGAGKGERLACGLTRVPRPEGWDGRMGEDPLLYFPRLTRDGWTLEGHEREGKRSQSVSRWIFTREVRSGWTLRKTFTASLGEKGPSGEIYWETHDLIGPEGERPVGDEWAEVDGRSVIFAAKGALYRMRVHAKGPEEPVRIADLNPNRFSPVEAPYAGLDRLDRRAARGPS